MTAVNNIMLISGVLVVGFLVASIAVLLIIEIMEWLEND